MGVADFCWAGRILHCLSKTDCKKFLRNTCSLLKPGGSLYGTAAGFAEAREHVATPDGTAHRIFHSPVNVACIQCLFSLSVTVNVVYEECVIRIQDPPAGQ